MDTPITLSSTESEPPLPEVISLDPTESQSLRMSVSSITKASSDVSCPSAKTLSNLQKVTNWMNTFHSTFSGESSEEFSEPSLTSSLDRQNGSRSKGLMFLRYDFDKPTKSRSPESCEFPSQPVKSNENRYNGKDKEKYPKINVKKIRRDSEKSVMEVHCQDVKTSKSENGSLYKVPLSPDSHKKELCTYLQLMNPLDKKEIFILQNRRSSRVRNLEKKELEKKSREMEYKALEVNKSNPKHYLMLKSLKDLNITIDRIEHFEHKEKKTFVFPSPKFNVKVVQDFDDMERIIVKYRKDIGRKEKPKMNKSNERRTMKNKENVKKLRRKEAMQKINRTLRSTTKISSKKLRKRKEKKKEERSQQRRKFREKIDERRLKTSKQPKPRLTPLPTPSSPFQISPKLSETEPVTTSSDLVTVETRTQDLELQSFIDSADIDSLTEEHKKSIIEARLLLPPSADSVAVAPKPIQTEHASSSCEIVTAKPESEDLVDIQNFVDDMMDFKNLSEEHKKCLIETRIMTSGSRTLTSLSPFFGYSSNDLDKFKEMCEKHVVSDSGETQKADSEKDPVVSQEQPEFQPKIKPVAASELLACETESTHSNEITSNGVINQEKESGYGDSDRSKTPQIRDSRESEECTITPFSKNPTDIKSLHRSLCSKRKLQNSSDLSPRHVFSPDKQKKNQHGIYLEREDGPIVKAFYLEYNLIICQEGLVSFYTQTALGNVLGAQNMWIPKGSTRRLTLSNKCIQKESTEMVVSTENNIVYIELWTKEHKSDIRANPVADIFATIYFWKLRQTGLEKKVLQLENISGFADDVQYSVLKYSPTIVVCWHAASNEIEDRKTFIHSYQLADDYQTVGNISELEPVGHYVSSLHNIEDCENLIMGCGENKITLWNLEYGYIVATIELNEIKSPLCTLWVKSDRGFLFTLQQCVDKELRLIAINGMNHSWKKLASYIPPKSFDRLRGVCVENGIIVSFYDRGVICWNAQTGEPIVEETQSEIEYIPSQKYVIMSVNDQVVVKHAVTHLISPEDV